MSSSPLSSCSSLGSSRGLVRGCPRVDTETLLSDELDPSLKLDMQMVSEVQDAQLSIFTFALLVECKGYHQVVLPFLV